MSTYSLIPSLPHPQLSLLAVWNCIWQKLRVWETGNETSVILTLNKVPRLFFSYPFLIAPVIIVGKSFRRYQGTFLFHPYLFLYLPFPCSQRHITYSMFLTLPTVSGQMVCHEVSPGHAYLNWEESYSVLHWWNRPSTTTNNNWRCVQNYDVIFGFPHYILWNPSIADTIGNQHFSKVSLTQGLPVYFW